MIAVSLVDCQSKWGREQDDMVCASASPRDARMCGGDSGVYFYIAFSFAISRLFMQCNVKTQVGHS
jgi:hypothetical protein